MNKWIFNLPIKSKLMFIVMLTNIAGLLLAGTIIIAYDGERGKKDMLEDISSIALLIADRSTAALTFDDPGLAAENLAALRVKTSVTAAYIYDAKGSLFASYSAGGSVINAVGASVTGKKNGIAGGFVTPPFIKTVSWHKFDRDMLTLVEPIVLNSGPAGSVYIKASLAELTVRRQNTMFFIAALIVISSIFTFFLSLWLQRMISGPLEHLTGISKHIALEKDYSVRAVKTSGDETGLLVTAFNEMLETIDERNKSNERYRVRQEELIEEQKRDIVERKLVELELRESEEKFQKAFMSSPEAMAIVSLQDSIYIDVNDNYLQLSEFSRDEIIGRSVRQYNIAKSNDDLDRFNEIIKKEGRIRDYEVEYRSKRDRTGIVVISAETIKIGNQLCLLKHYQDITARVNAQKSLKESEDRYREIFEKVSAGIFQTAKDGRILIANPAFAKMLGYNSAAELLSAAKNMKTSIYLNPEKRDELIDLISKYGSVSNYEVKVLKKNKEIINVFINKHVVKNDAGEILYYEGTMEDITLQKRFSELKSAMNIAQLGYWEYDVATGIFTINDEFFSIFHTTAEKSGGRNLPLSVYADLFCHPDDYETVKKEIKRAVETGDYNYSEQAEQQIIYLDNGEAGYIHYQIFIAKDAEGRTVKIYCAVQDITKTKKQIVELQAARETAERATRSKSEFLAKMSHEIRTPLGAVIGLNNLLDRTALDKKQKDYVTKIKNSAAYLLQVINDILDFTKIESGKMELEHIEFPLENILEDIGDFASIKSMGKNIEVIIDKDPAVPSLLAGDPLRLKQVLLNLVNNSIKFTDKGTIIVKIFPGRTIDNKIELDFSVSDTGIGMTEFQLENIFKAYSQADSTTSRKYGGTGLGLNICYKFVDMMGGRLSAKSEFGRGSTFYFTIPFDLPEIKDSRPQRRVPEDIKDINILVADDSELFRKVVDKYVSRLGLSCCQASSGSEAIAELKRKPFDVIFIDCALSGMNGFDTIKKIQNDPAVTKMPKVVFVTTLSDEAVLSEIEAAGIKTVLFKPLNESVIFNTIVNLFKSEGRDMVRKKAGRSSLPADFDLIKSAKILVAEDNEINRQIILEILENQGFEVLIACDGRECVEIYKKEKDIALILMDVQMPEMDGIEAASYIRRDLKDEDIKIIALTADVIHETRERINAAGMNDFVSKPIDEAELFRAMAKWIDASKVSRRAPAALPEPEPGPVPSAGKDAAEGSVTAGSCDTSEIAYSEGIRRVTGNEKLYRDLLKKFIAGNEKITVELEGYIYNQQYSSLAKRIHNFKGVAANLGLKALSALAAKIQTAAESQQDEAGALISLLDAKVKAAFKDIEKFLGGNNSKDDAAEDELEFLNGLKRLLPVDEMAARDYFADGRVRLKFLGGSNYDPLTAAMDIYDFEAAAKELDVLIKTKEGNRDA